MSINYESCSTILYCCDVKVLLQIQVWHNLLRFSPLGTSLSNLQASILPFFWLITKHTMSFSTKHLITQPNKINKNNHCKKTSSVCSCCCNFHLHYRKTNLFVTLFTMVCIGTLKQVTLDVLFQRLEKILLVADVNVQHRERLLTWITGAHNTRFFFT